MAMMRMDNWTDDEIAVMKEMSARGATSKAIGDRLGRSDKAVRCKRRAVLGAGTGRSCALWSDAENATMRRLASEGMTPTQIFESGELPGRSRDAIGVQACKLRITKPALDDDAVVLKPFEELSVYHQRTLRRLLPAWFGGRE